MSNLIFFLKFVTRKTVSEARAIGGLRTARPLLLLVIRDSLNPPEDTGPCGFKRSVRYTSLYLLTSALSIESSEGTPK